MEKDGNLGITAYRVLQYVIWRKKIPSLLNEKLARRLGTSPSNLHQIMDKLMSQEYVLERNGFYLPTDNAKSEFSHIRNAKKITLAIFLSSIPFILVAYLLLDPFEKPHEMQFVGWSIFGSSLTLFFVALGYFGIIDKLIMLRQPTKSNQ
ncbi:MAG: hypothetical protein HZA84_04470 [Thaumarchaeota archaeon]|nr:hypothetical protein [Nitrososphaerota archaeon]